MKKAVWDTREDKYPVILRSRVIGKPAADERGLTRGGKAGAQPPKDFLSNE
jgi:hypothetical protein